MGYLRGTLNDQKRITLDDLTRMISMIDPVAIGVDTLKIVSVLWRTILITCH